MTGWLLDLYPDLEVTQGYGMTELSVEDLVFVANSWNQAPTLVVTGDGFVSVGYDLGRRAYQLSWKDAAAGVGVNLRLWASEAARVC